MNKILYFVDKCPQINPAKLNVWKFILIFSFFSQTINAQICTQTPILSEVAINNSCAGTTVNLNDIITSSLPTNAQLLWYDNIAHTGIPIDGTASPEGTYYAFYYDEINDCHGPASQPIVVSILTAPSAPIVSTNTLYICYGFAYHNLVSLVSSTTPSGYNLEWQFGGTTVPNPGAVTQVGTYSAQYVSNTGGCNSAVSDVEIVNAPYPTISTTSVTINCSIGTADLTGIITPSTISGFESQWFPSPSTSNPPPISDITNVAGGNYEAFYYNASIGCYSIAPAPILTIDYNNEIVDAPVLSENLIYSCYGFTEHNLPQHVSSATPTGYFLQFYQNGILVTLPQEAPLDPKVYQVQYTSQFSPSCQSSTTVDLEVALAPYPSISTNVVNICSPLTTADLTDIISTPPAGFNAEWYLNDTGAAISEITAVGEGVYHAYYWSAPLNCYSISPAPMLKVELIAVASSPTGDCTRIGMTNDAEISLLAATVANANYAWSGPNGFTSIEQNPIIPYSTPDQNGLYTLEVTVGTCSDINDVNIDCLTALPIDLISFDAKQINEKNIITWKTANMKGFDSFQLEKSNEGLAFEYVNTIKINENKTETQYFSVVDKFPKIGNNYYRLKMTNNDGTFSYSKIISVNFEKGAIYFYARNPVESNSIELKTNISIPSFSLKSINGQEAPISFQKNDENTFLINSKNLPNGIYFLIIENGGDKKILKLLMK